MTPIETNPKHARAGLTILEVLVAIIILAVVSVAIVGLLPGITRTTVAGADDVVQTQRMVSVLERVGDAWRDGDEFADGNVGDDSLAAFVTANLGTSCSADSPSPANGVRTVVITCDAIGALPAQELRQAFGDPR